MYDLEITFHDLMYFSKHWLTHPSSCGVMLAWGWWIHFSKQFSVILFTSSVALATASSWLIWSWSCCLTCCDCVEAAVAVDDPKRAMVKGYVEDLEALEVKNYKNLVDLNRTPSAEHPCTCMDKLCTRPPEQLVPKNPTTRKTAHPCIPQSGIIRLSDHYRR